MAVTDRIETLIAPELSGLGVSLYDIEMAGDSLRILLDVEGGISVSQLRKASRIISAILDEEDPISGAYLLEVSSPGLERRLRTQAHFAGAIGTKATIKLLPTVTGERRIAGVITAADEDTFTVTDDKGDASDRDRLCRRESGPHRLRVGWPGEAGQVEIEAEEEQQEEIHKCRAPDQGRRPTPGESRQMKRVTR